MMPALLMTTSRPPKRCRVSVTSRSAPAGMRTSQATVRTSAPRASRSLRARSSSSSSLAQMARRAPRLASSRQRTSPSPREPPVTSTTAPRRSAMGASQRARTATDAAPAANASPFFIAVPPGGRSAPEANAERSSRSGGRKPVLPDLVSYVLGESHQDITPAHVQHLAVPVPAVADLVAELKPGDPLRWLRWRAFARGSGRSRRERLPAVVATPARRARLFREVLAQGADAAADRLRVMHHLLEPVAVAGMALFVAGKETVQLFRPQRSQRNDVAPPALGSAGPDELRGDHLDLLFRQVGLSRQLACAGRAARDGAPDGEGVLAARVLAAKEERLHALVFEPVEQDRACGLPVPSGAAYLLQVRLQRIGEVPVHDEADVGLVDAHPECAGRHHDPRAAAHEAFLDLLALAGGELAVITACVDAVRDEETVEVLDGADGRGVDDPAPFFLAKDAQEGFALRCTIHRAQDFVPQVRTLDSEVDDLGAGHSELANDVFHYLPRRRRREGKDRRPCQRAYGVV